MHAVIRLQNKRVQHVPMIIVHLFVSLSLCYSDTVPLEIR